MMPAMAASWIKIPPQIVYGFLQIWQPMLRFAKCQYPSLAELQKDKLNVGRAWYYGSDKKQLYVRTGAASPASDHIYHVSQHPYAIHLTRSQHVVVRGFTMRHAGAALVRISEGAQGCILLENKLH